MINSNITDQVKALTEKKIWLAPLAGYTDKAFRTVCKYHGADITVSEMVSADGIIYNQKQTLAYMHFAETERPFGIQLFGSVPDVMAKAAEIACNYQPDFIDINMGCPVKKVNKRGAGGALMQNIGNAAEIVQACKSVLRHKLPLSVKFRSGQDSNSLNFLEYGLAMQEAGADIITLHPRTVKQMFTGVSNWEHIKELKSRLSIPLIGNGDIRTVADALQMYAETGCDGIMIGRGAVGNPWIFGQIKSTMAGGEVSAVSLPQKLETIFMQLEAFLSYRPERLVVKEIRSHLCYYTKSMNGAAKLRDAINHTSNLAELKHILTQSFEEEHYGK